MERMKSCLKGNGRYGVLLNNMKPPLLNVACHYGAWPYDMTPFADKTLYQFMSLLLNWTLLPSLRRIQIYHIPEGFHRWSVLWHANRGCFLIRIPCPVPFGTRICSDVEASLSGICHDFEYPSALLIYFWKSHLFCFLFRCVFFGLSSNAISFLNFMFK